MRLTIAALATTVTLIACTSAPPPRPAPSPTRPLPGRPASAAFPTGAGVHGSLADRVVRLARSLVDTPYRHAGDDRRGFDCSGLTSFVFEEVGLALPRTAERQGRTGRWIAADELAPGDLVFFGETRDKPHHVGLVVSEPGEPLAMIHASSSRGVIETEVTSSPYWLARLSFGRRVLPR